MDKDSSSITFWDGKTYSRARLEREWPGLADYVVNHQTLAEVVQFDREGVVRRHFRLTYVVTAVIGVFLEIGVFFGFPISELLAATGAVLFFMLLFFGFYIVMFYIAGLTTMKGAFPKVTAVKDGIVHVNDPERSLTAELAHLRWYRGYESEAVNGTQSWYFHRPAIILLFPTTGRSRAERLAAKVACGITQEMRFYWEALLTLAEVPQEAP